MEPDNLKSFEYCKSQEKYYLKLFYFLANYWSAPQVGIEPTTNWLTANCSTAELLWNAIDIKMYQNKMQVFFSYQFMYVFLEYFIFLIYQYQQTLTFLLNTQLV